MYYWIVFFRGCFLVSSFYLFIFCSFACSVCVCVFSCWAGHPRPTQPHPIPSHPIPCNVPTLPPCRWLVQIVPPTAASIVANGVNGLAKPEADAAAAAASSDEPADATTDAPEAEAKEDGAEVSLALEFVAGVWLGWEEGCCLLLLLLLLL